VAPDRDLLADWTDAICNGRTGQAGWVICHAALDEERIRAIIRDRLREATYVESKLSRVE
jgi:hypothetical protein